MVDVWAEDSVSGQPSYSGYDLRMTTIAPYFAGAGSGVGVRTGVRPSGSGTDLLVQAQGSPNMSVLVNPGAIIVQGTYSASQGPYTWALDTQVTRNITASHATLDRTDLVAVRIRDSNIDSSGSRDGDVIVITGTAGSGTPAVPTDATYVVIAQIAVAHAVTSIVAGNITDKRPFTSAAGGLILCASTTRPSSPAPGQAIFEFDTGLARRWSGSSWRLVEPYRSRNTLSSSAATLQVSIPSGMREAELTWHVRGDAAGEKVDMLLMVDNNSSSSYYYGHHLSIQGASGLIGTQDEAANAGVFVGPCAASSAGAGNFGGGFAKIQGLGSGVEDPDIQFASHLRASPTNSFYVFGGSIYTAATPLLSFTLKPVSGNFVASSWLAVVAVD